MPTSDADAVWEGGLKGGKGHYSAATGSFSGDYTFSSRFVGDGGTNPEELIAAAHAACFSMALAAGLEAAGTPPTRIATRAACTVEKKDGGFRITTMKLVCRGSVPGIDQSAFRQAAESAKGGCPVSLALQGNVAVELDAQLESA